LIRRKASSLPRPRRHTQPAALPVPPRGGAHELVGLLLDLGGLGVVLLLRKHVLDSPQVQVLLRVPRDGRPGDELLLELAELSHVALLHRQDEARGVLLVVGHAAVPLRVELLKLEHVRLLHAEALRQLSRAHGLAPAVLLVHAQLVEPRSRDVRLHILALPLAVEPVLLQD